MLYSTEGIVFKALKYSESSLILDIYTIDKGLRSYIVSGVRGKKPKISPGIVQPMQQVYLTAYDKPAEKLSRIKEVKLSKVYAQIPVDVRRSMVAVFMIDLARTCIREPEAAPDLYRFIADQLEALDQLPLDRISYIPLYFALGLSTFLGFPPLDNYEETQPYFDLVQGRFSQELSIDYGLDEHMSLLLSQLQSGLATRAPLSFSKAERAALLDRLMTFYQLQYEAFKPLKSLEILKTIFQ